jgi:hypothetical protein
MPDDQREQPPKPRTKKRGGLFVTDAELIERLNVPEKIARAALRLLDSNPASGFPKKQKVWGNRRYWPAVADWLDVTLGNRITSFSSYPGVEQTLAAELRERASETASR